MVGYPEGHINAVSLEDDIHYLKEKVDAGADYIVTQLFYDVDIFLTWLKKIRDAGITCPVLPGVMPIQSFGGFTRMTTLCKTIVPSFITDELEEIKAGVSIRFACSLLTCYRMTMRRYEITAFSLRYKCAVKCN